MRNSSENGFSLIEVMIASGILATGLLSMAGMFVVGLDHLRSSTPGLIAREKAREAVESVHTARDMRIITWDEIRNVADDGVFRGGEQPLKLPGVDGLMNTADDDLVELEAQTSPGPDNELGNYDDIVTPLRDFTRQIEIVELLDENNLPNDNLRLLRVTVRFKVGDAWRAYTLTTYISSYS
jgi:prepilin-type N-terminal cleavage/methylation domain-containing protein